MFCAPCDDQAKSIHKSPQMEIRPFEHLKAGDYFNIVSTIAFSALIVTAIALSIHYGTHPTGNFIPITSNFSMRLPLLVSLSGGAGIAILFMAQIARKKVTHSYERAFGQLVYSNDSLRELLRNALHPCGREEGTGRDYWDANKDEIDYVCSMLNAKVVEFLTKDEVALRGIWHCSDPKNPTVVLFHGNGMVAEQMANWGGYYLERGFNVLLAEYRGYGISEGEAAGNDQELHASYDVSAIIQFLRDQGVDLDKVLGHGYSLGGAYAAIMAQQGIKHVVLSHTFTSFGDVIHNVVKSVIKLPVITTGSTREMAEGAFDQYLPIQKGKPKTDGWDSLAKITNAGHAQIFVIRGKKDKLMALSFGEQFVKGKYPTDALLRKNRLITIEGGHCDVSEFFSDEAAIAKHLQFLEDIGLISED